MSANADDMTAESINERPISRKTIPAILVIRFLSILLARNLPR
jgi:hypothetical protein